MIRNTWDVSNGSKLGGMGMDGDSERERDGMNETDAPKGFVSSANSFGGLYLKKWNRGRLLYSRGREP